MTLAISILGPLVIESGDCRLGKVPKKARALVAFLAAQVGQPVTRERLADLLWPYQGSEQARHSLRNCLLELRKALGRGTDAHLAADFANCRIQDAIVDLVQFEPLSPAGGRGLVPRRTPRRLRYKFRAVSGMVGGGARPHSRDGLRYPASIEREAGCGRRARDCNTDRPP